MGAGEGFAAVDVRVKEVGDAVCVYVWIDDIRDTVAI